MTWLRYASIRAIWKCFTTRGYTTKYHAVGVAIKDEYEKKPTEDIDNWAKRLGNFVANKMCENSCQSLSTSVFCDKTSVESETVYTSETLVVVPKIPEAPKIPEVPTVPEVPEFVLKTIEDLEKRKAEAKTTERKDKIQSAINELKKEYGIK